MTGKDKNPDPPSEQSPTDTDQTHSVNLQASLELPADFLEGSLSGRLLSNSSVFVTWHFHTGRPYTVVDQLGNLATGENNNSRTRSQRYANLRLTRRFFSTEKRRLSLFVEVMNLFNDRNYKSSMVNSTTGQPGVDAYLLGELERTITGFTVRPEAVSVQAEAANSELSSDPAERLALARRIAALKG